MISLQTSTDLCTPFSKFNFDFYVDQRSKIENDGNGKAKIGCLILSKSHQCILRGRI